MKKRMLLLNLLLNFIGISIIANFLYKLEIIHYLYFLLISIVMVGIYQIIEVSMRKKEIKTILNYIKDARNGKINSDKDIKLSNLDQKIINEIDLMSKDLNKLISEISVTAQKMNNLLYEVNTSSEKLEVTFEEVSNTVSEIAIDINNVTDKTNEISENSKKMFSGIESITDLIKNTNDKSKSMGKSIKNSSENMNSIIEKVSENSIDNMELSNELVDLEEDFKEITNIVEMINSISKQTNLLALNASIEAARVGEAGKGFAVVANEVKVLAEESNSSSEIIKKQLEKINNAIIKISSKKKNVANESKVTNEYAEKAMNVLGKANTEVDSAIASVSTIDKLIVEQFSLTTSIVNDIEESNENSKKISNGIEETSSITEEQSANLNLISENIANIYNVSNEFYNMTKEYSDKLIIDNNFLNEAESILSSVKEIIDNKNVMDIDKNEFDEIMKLSNKIGFIAVINDAGRGIKFSVDDIGLLNIDVSFRPFFKEAMAHGSFISNPYVSLTDDKYCITVSSSIVYDNNLQGVISVDLII